MRPVWTDELMKRRDEIAGHLRTLGMRCFATVDLMKPSGGATLFMENWVKGDRVVLLIVDKFGGICTYRMTTSENSMAGEKAALTNYLDGEKRPAG